MTHSQGVNFDVGIEKEEKFEKWKKLCEVGCFYIRLKRRESENFVAFLKNSLSLSLSLLKIVIWV